MGTRSWPALPPGSATSSGAIAPSCARAKLRMRSASRSRSWRWSGAIASRAREFVGAEFPLGARRERVELAGPREECGLPPGPHLLHDHACPRQGRLIDRALGSFRKRRRGRTAQSGEWRQGRALLRVSGTACGTERAPSEFRGDRAEGDRLLGQTGQGEVEEVGRLLSHFFFRHRRDQLVGLLP